MNKLDNTLPAFITPVIFRDSDDLKCFKYCAESVFNQSDPHWIWIIVDDNSTFKEGIEYLESLANKDWRINVIYNEKNIGPGASRNKAINYAYDANCPFLMFLDSDDMAHKNRLKNTRKHFKDENVIACYSYIDYIDYLNNDIGENIPPLWKISQLSIFNKDIIKQDLKPEWLNFITAEGCYIVPSCSTFSVDTSIAYHIKFPDNYIFEDFCFIYSCCSLNGHFVYDKTIPSKYRFAKLGDMYVSRTMAIKTKNQEPEIPADYIQPAWSKILYLSINNHNLSFEHASKIIKKIMLYQSHKWEAFDKDRAELFSVLSKKHAFIDN